MPALAAATTNAKSVSGVDYYEKLGVQTFINAAGTYTNLSSACMPEQVQEAVALAAKKWVRIGELQQKAGTYIANRLKTEGCCASLRGQPRRSRQRQRLASRRRTTASRSTSPPHRHAEVPEERDHHSDPAWIRRGDGSARREDRGREHARGEYKRAFNENTVMTNHENAAETVKIPDGGLAGRGERTRRSPPSRCRGRHAADLEPLDACREVGPGLLLRRQGHSRPTKRRAVAGQRRSTPILPTACYHRWKAWRAA